MNQLLGRSAELEAALTEFLWLRPFDRSPRVFASRALCGLAMEHAESMKLLLAAGNFTSAAGLLRLQYEALVRAVWLYYAASDAAAEKLAVELTEENARKAAKLPMLSKMLNKLEGKAPAEPLRMLIELKQYSWKPLSSFVHGGIHAIQRHSKGYPAPLLDQALRASNGVSLMVGMMLVILSGDPAQLGKIPKIQVSFADCLPPPRPIGS